MFSYLFQSYIQYTFWTKLNVLDGNINKSPAWAIVWDAWTNQGSHKLLRYSDSILSVDILAMITTICPHFALVWLNDSYVYHPSTFFSTWKFVSVVHARQDKKIMVLNVVYLFFFRLTRQRHAEKNTIIWVYQL